MALGLMEVLIRRGVAVPKDISVVGFDDSEIAQRDPVLMTSVHQDAESLARIAVERASQRIHPSSPPTDPHGTLVPTHLVVRSTTGEAPRR
ncbi:substrate-binding domain-containing protein [Propionibacterium freudenreichii]|uniref:substrate-binding domain-containing protein n=1 Tax=Propionibacterium freudenreichii TaxID=1744 RepID=UPI0039BF13CF